MEDSEVGGAMMLGFYVKKNKRKATFAALLRRSSASLSKILKYCRRLITVACIVPRAPSGALVRSRT
jgi:hypothetical protein